METKSYPIADNEPLSVAEPAVAYLRRNPERSGFRNTGNWGPNALFNGTQEEFLEHIHRIEQGNFTPLEEANREFELWKTEYLASRLK
jgi:hypothetical protein